MPPMGEPGANGSLKPEPMIEDVGEMKIALREIIAAPDADRIARFFRRTEAAWSVQWTRAFINVLEFRAASRGAAVGQIAAAAPPRVLAMLLNTDADRAKRETLDRLALQQ